MPRRRMLDPSFTDDIEVAQLTRDERLFLVGCLRNADDDGRLMGNRAFLKAEIFMYDEDIDLQRMQEIRDSTLEKMEHWRPDNIWRLVAYQNGGQDYICFPNWSGMERPSHPTPSKLPAPPPETLGHSGEPQEAIESLSSESLEERKCISGETPSQSSLGQSSQVKYSVVQSSAVREDFTKFKNDNDLTDYLTKTLRQYIRAGRERVLGSEPGELSQEKEATVRAQWGIPVLEKLWNQFVGKMSHALWEGGYASLKKYPLEVVARAFVKACRYQGGKHKSWKYIQMIIDEEMGKHGHSPEERSRSP